MRNLGKVTYLLQEKSTLKEEKVNSAHIQPYIAGGTEERISEPAPATFNTQETFYLLAPPIHLVVAVKITVPCFQKTSTTSSSPCNSKDNFSSVSPIKPSLVKLPSNNKCNPCNVTTMMMMMMMIVHWHQTKRILWP